MRKLFSTSIKELYANLCLLTVRMVVSGFMLSHGLPKLAKFNVGGKIEFAAPFGLSPTVSLGLAVFAEVFCSVLVIIGWGTRLAVIPLIIMMSVAAFYVHANDPFAVKEKALLFIIIYVMLLVFGSGKYSMDRLVSSSIKKY